MEENNLLLDINNLRVSFFTPAGEVKAVNGISYNLKHSEVIGIVGESGSGKSVSAYSLLGLVDAPGKVVGGSVTFDNKDILSMKESQKKLIRGKEIAMIFQDPMTCLNPVFTIGDQIREALNLYNKIDKKEISKIRKKENKTISKQKAEILTKIDINKRAAELLALVGINEPERRLKQYPHEFSGGMRQRAMIAMALAGNPKLLIADEPTTALDVTIQAQILELLVDIKKKINMSIMLITHDLGIVAGLADKVIVMYGGTIVEQADVTTIFKNPLHPYTKGLLHSLPRLDGKSGKLEPIPGSPIDLLNAPKGCPFAPRCDKCMKVCIDHAPPYFESGADHKAACWLMHEHAKQA